MKEIKFLEDTRQQDIVSALLSGQRKIVIDNVEVHLKPLKHDLFKNKEQQAIAQANDLIKLLDS